MKPTSRFLILSILFWLTLSPSMAQEKYQPTPENMKTREWFQDAKFGLFIHWGVYSVLGDGEWVMNQQQIPIKTYEKIPSFFNPTQFNPAEWVQMVKDAGMKYITITSKHHDGFAMYDSKISNYDIVERTPYGKDVLKCWRMNAESKALNYSSITHNLIGIIRIIFPEATPEATGRGVKKKGT